MKNKKEKQTKLHPGVRLVLCHQLCQKSVHIPLHLSSVFFTYFTPSCFSAADSREQGHLSDVPGQVTALILTWSTGPCFLCFHKEGMLFYIPEGPPVELVLLNTQGFLFGSHFLLKQSCSFVAYLLSASCKPFLEFWEMGQYHIFKSQHVCTRVSTYVSDDCL